MTEDAKLGSGNDHCTSDTGRVAYVVRSGEEYDDWRPDAVFTNDGDAKEFIKNRCRDFGEWVEWEDGGGIIWNSEESYVAGYRIDPVELDPENRDVHTGSERQNHEEQA